MTTRSLYYTSCACSGGVPAYFSIYDFVLCYASASKLSPPMGLAWDGYILLKWLSDIPICTPITLLIPCCCLFLCSTSSPFCFHSSMLSFLPIALVVLFQLSLWVCAARWSGRGPLRWEGKILQWSARPGRMLVLMTSRISLRQATDFTLYWPI